MNFLEELPHLLKQSTISQIFSYCLLFTFSKVNSAWLITSLRANQLQKKKFTSKVGSKEK